MKANAPDIIYMPEVLLDESWAKKVEDTDICYLRKDLVHSEDLPPTPLTSDILEKEIHNMAMKLHTAPTYEELRSFALHFVDWKRKPRITRIKRIYHKFQGTMTTNDIAKIQLFRTAATMPWAEVETTQQNVRLTYYDGAHEDAKQTVIVLTRDEAKDITKALKVLADNYFAEPNEED